MKKKGTGNWKPLNPPAPDSVPVQGSVRVGRHSKMATVVLPIDPNTLQLVPEKGDKDE